MPEAVREINIVSQEKDILVQCNICIDLVLTSFFFCESPNESLTSSFLGNNGPLGCPSPPAAPHPLDSWSPRLEHTRVVTVREVFRLTRVVQV